MSANSKGRPPKVSDRQILKHVREDKRPFTTTSEVAEKLPIGIDGVRHRLNNLEDRGEINRDKVGRSVVWWIPD